MQNRTQNLDSFSILKMSVTAAGINGIMTNFLEVIKVRIISDSIRCNPIHYSAKSMKGFFNSNTKNQILAFENCGNNCLPSRNAFEVAQYILKTEGLQAFFRGAMGQSLQQMIRAGSFFPLYHQTLNFFKSNVTQNSYYLPLMSSACARFISVCMTFGIEKYTTELQASKATDIIKKSKISANTGFTAIASRDIFYSAIMWTL